MMVSTTEQSTFNKLAYMEMALRSDSETARAKGQEALAAHLEALMAQIQATKIAALEAAGLERRV